MLRCVVCGNSIPSAGDTVRCHRCGALYRKKHGYPHPGRGALAIILGSVIVPVAIGAFTDTLPKRDKPREVNELLTRSLLSSMFASAVVGLLASAG